MFVGCYCIVLLVPVFWLIGIVLGRAPLWSLLLDDCQILLTRDWSDMDVSATWWWSSCMWCCCVVVVPQFRNTRTDNMVPMIVPSCLARATAPSPPNYIRSSATARSFKLTKTSEMGHNSKIVTGWHFNRFWHDGDTTVLHWRNIYRKIQTTSV